jgi:elongator complex protein 6
VDGLTELFMPIPPSPPISIQASNATTPPSTTSKTSMSTPPKIAPRSPLYPHPQPRIPSASLTPAKSLHWTNGADSLDIVEKDILDVIASISRLSRKVKAENAGAATANEKNVMLVIEGLDLLLATTGVGVVEMGELVMALREKADSLILVLSADSPLLHLPTSPTPLETAHASFLISLAHQARTVYQLRSLDTGTARDVSGVVRVSNRGDEDEEEEKEGEGEYLFHLGGSGSVGGGGGDVRVWVRGETGQ